MDPAMRSNSQKHGLWLSALIVVIATMTLRVVAPMSGHMDEFDYLFVGKTLLSSQGWPTLTYIFGADFNWYPFAIADNTIGGLNGARLVSLTLGLLSLATSWFICFRLWACSRTATIAMLLVSVSASHLFISRHVSYDIISYFFFTLSLYTLLRCCQEKKNRVIWSLLGVGLYATSVFSKYILLIYAPFILSIMLVFKPRMAIIGGAALCTAFAVYLWQFQDELLILYENQVVAVHGTNATHAGLLTLIAGFLLIPICLSAIALASASIDHAAASKRNTLIIAICLVMAVPLIGYHVVGANKISLYKHMVYSVFFLSFPAAWALNRIIESSSENTITRHVFPIAALALTVQSTLHFQSLRTGYPDVRDMLSVARPILGESTTILSEDPYLFRYIQFGNTDQRTISETGWLDYDRDGSYGTEDVELALKAQHFELVFLNDQIDPESNQRFRDLLAQENYRVLYSEPYLLSSAMTNNRSGHISLYQRQTSTKQPQITGAISD